MVSLPPLKNKQTNKTPECVIRDVWIDTNRSTQACVYEAVPVVGESFQTLRVNTRNIKESSVAKNLEVALLCISPVSYVSADVTGQGVLSQVC